MSKDIKDLNILLVEDEMKLAQLLKSAIGDNFASFFIENNGKAGIERYLKLSPDLVITDITMPELTGLEMAEELKKINPDVQIIILSAYSEKEKLLSAIDVGVIKYFIKPFDPDELLEYIKQISKKLKNNYIMLEENFKINTQTNTLYKNDEYITLTKREQTFLQLLVKNKDTFTSVELMNKHLWKDNIQREERLRTFIKRLRIKTSKKIILNIKGQGYRLGVL